MGSKVFANEAEKLLRNTIVTPDEPVSASYGLGIEEHDNEGRVVTLEFGDFFLTNVYTPNAQDELERLRLPERVEQSLSRTHAPNWREANRLFFAAI